MRELQIIRSAHEKRRLDVDGIGTVRFENMWGTKLRLSAPGRGDWRISAGWRGGANTALDATGAVAATVVDGRIEQGARAVTITKPHRGIFERRPPFVLLEGDHELARVAPHVWSEKPVDVTLMDEDFA